MDEQEVRWAIALVGSAALASIGTWLSSAQNYSDYSEWAIWVILFVISMFSRFRWISGLIMVWLLALYFAPPAVVAALKGLVP